MSQRHDGASSIHGLDDAGPLPIPPGSIESMVEMALEAPADERLSEYRELIHRREGKFLLLKEGLDPENLREAGWGLVVPETVSTEVIEALQPLIDKRCQETGESRPRQLTYRAGESGAGFLTRYGLGPGPVDPSRVPYYLLLVGPPTAIPFAFQQYLGVKHAVGRVDFEVVSDYQSYAENVVRCEQTACRLERRVGLFGPLHDEMTQQSNEYLFHPLQEALGVVDEWKVDSYLGPEAKKECHLDLVGGSSPPAFLLSVCHGLGWQYGHHGQRDFQGAQVCQPPGTGMDQGHSYVAGDDIDRCQRGPQGQILFMNGCFSAGTPKYNTYRHRGREEDDLCAPEPFTARLAQRLLAHPEGALAVLGHVDRTWNYTFRWPGPDLPQVAVFESASRALMQGRRVGAAIEQSFGHRFAELSVQLAEIQNDCAFGYEPGLHLRRVLTARNDAKSVVVLGDPAVRLAVEFAD